ALPRRLLVSRSSSPLTGLAFPPGALSSRTAARERHSSRELLRRLPPSLTLPTRGRKPVPDLTREAGFTPAVRVVTSRRLPSRTLRKGGRGETCSPAYFQVTLKTSYSTTSPGSRCPAP